MTLKVEKYQQNSQGSSLYRQAIITDNITSRKFNLSVLMDINAYRIPQ